MPTNLDTVPLELQTMIAQHLVDPNDVLSTLKNVESLRLVNRAFFHISEETFNMEAFEKADITLQKNYDTLAEMPAGPFVGSHKELKLHYLVSEANFIPIKSAGERRALLKSMLDYKWLTPAAASPLISNIQYLKSEEIGRISNDVVSYSLDYDTEGWRDLVPQLVNEVEYLTPDDRSKVVKASCQLPVEMRRTHLKFWSTKMNMLNDGDQRLILSSIDLDSDNTARSLACFAEHTDKLSQSSSAELATRIVDLPANRPEKWRALSHLAEHLPRLDPMARNRVVRHIIDNHATAVEKAVEPDGEMWYSKTAFCRVEALHHLSAHERLLAPQDFGEVKTVIKKTIDRSDSGRFASQAQLITHLPKEKRNGFVSKAFKQDEGNSAEIAYALTARIKDLNKQEIVIYGNRILRNISALNFSDKIIDYNIKNNLNYLTDKQRSWHIGHKAEIFAGNQRYNYDYVSSGFAEMARGGKYLSQHDIDSIVGTAKKYVEEHMERAKEMDEEEIGLVLSCSGHAVRCLAGWAEGQISNTKAPVNAGIVIPLPEAPASPPAAGPSNVTGVTGKRKLEEITADQEAGTSSLEERQRKRRQLDVRSRSSSVGR